MNDSLQFSKQFLIASKHVDSPVLNDWSRSRIKGGNQFYAHPCLQVTWAISPENELIGLGIFLDPASITADNKIILQRLCDTSDDFVKLEIALAGLGGRWALLASINGECRLYHDATGQKSVFFFTSETNDKYICSHPSLLDSIDLTVKDHQLVQEFEKYPNSGSWPINIVPYQNVKQLIPNHYLELSDLSVKRYWPAVNFEPLSMSLAAQKMGTLLKGLTESAANRQECILNLTGGYDSRLILASAKNFWTECDFFTVKRTDSPNHDASIPKKLRKRFKLEHVFISSCNADPDSEIAIANHELNQCLQQNVGGMRYDPSLQSTLAVKNIVGDKLHLLGLISEVNRCAYYHNGQHPAVITPKILAELSGFENNPIAEKGCAEWLATLPDPLPLNILDLFYWEHRLGVWASCGMTFAEAIIEQLSPMNCRNFLQSGLKTELKYRQKPYLLTCETINQLNPELLAFKFNYDLIDFFTGTPFNKLPIPWRMKKAIGMV